MDNSESPSTPLPAAPRNSDQKFCHACARVLHVSASICPSCGAHQPASTPIMGLTVTGQPSPDLHTQPAPISSAPQRTTADQRHCHGCGNIVHVSAPACPKCGAQQLGNTNYVGSTATIKSRVTGAVLAFFLGEFGVHKFYCGKVGMGFLYLVFFWTWIPALVALVEGIIFLTNSSSDEEFTQKYCA